MNPHNTRPLRYAILAWAAGLSVYAICLVALAPATLIDAGLQHAGGGRLRLAQAAGSLWSGTGQLEIRDAAGLRSVGRSLTWRARPASLLRGKLGFEVTLSQAGTPFSVELSTSGVEVTRADFVLPAALLGMAAPRLAVIGPTGELRVRIEHLLLSRTSVSGKGVIEWLDAGSTLTPVSPLGNYELRVSGSGGQVDATLHTLDGPLHLEGAGSGGSGPPAFVATARVDAPYQLQLAPFLRLIAVERKDGAFEFQFGQSPAAGRTRL